MPNGSEGQAAVGSMLAFAVGDALGWPLELRANRVGGTSDPRPELALRAWTRREMGRYAPHDELMPAGVYSDDTQLTLAVARSLRREEWWEHLTRVELPWWPHYELGGGGATQRASKAWAKSTPPWDPKGAKGYWEAGGNGAAMRVLPHCFAPGLPYAAVRRSIAADGATTHGDPVALVGAQAYAYALWTTIRRREPLGWGQLLEDVLDNSGEWAEIEPHLVPGGWAEALPAKYLERWQRTVDQMIGRLHDARSQMVHGALAVDQEVLEDLGCFSREAGAGTVTAAGALYLASRHAAEPDQALLRAAFARRADTDTLAAMTGALLGALHGQDWLGETANKIMDAGLLQRVALRFGCQAEEDAAAPYTKAAQKEADHRLAGASVGSREALPFYGEIEVLSIADLDNRSTRIRSWWLRNDQGQTFRVKRLSRAKRSPWRALGGIERKPTEPANGGIRSGLVLRVVDIGLSRAFYEGIVGLPVSRETRSAVVLAGWLALEQSEVPSLSGISESGALAVTLYADPHLFSLAQQRLKKSETRFSLEETEVARVLRTADPDGTPVEIRLHRPTGSLGVVPEDLGDKASVR